MSESGASFGLTRQMEIYQKGLTGERPVFPLSIEEMQERAREVLSPEAYGYIAGGAGSEESMRANRAAFDKRKFIPNLLRDVAARDLSVEILGQRIPAPFLLAPIGVQSILHKEGELAVARAARATNTPMILSTVSSYSMEEVAETLGDTPRWFQLYRPKDDDLTASFLQRAEKAGYSALVVTLDTYFMAWRERDLQNAYLPFLTGEGLANYFTDPVFCKAIGGSPKDDPVRAVQHFGQIFSSAAFTWADLEYLKQCTKLPILLKGILHQEDARRAAGSGMAGIIVSNHGGRQLDGAIGALDALPDVVDAVGSQMTVLFDSGIRRGADVIKATAMGADAVLLGRPYGFGLAVGGEEGVAHVIQNLRAETDLTMGLAGCASMAKVGEIVLV